MITQPPPPQKKKKTQKRNYFKYVKSNTIRCFIPYILYYKWNIPQYLVLTLILGGDLLLPSFGRMNMFELSLHYGYEEVKRSPNITEGFAVWNEWLLSYSYLNKCEKVRKHPQGAMFFQWISLETSRSLTEKHTWLYFRIHSPPPLITQKSLGRASLSGDFYSFFNVMDKVWEDNSHHA